MMRVRWHVPLPGPLAITGGRRRRGPGCLPWLAAAAVTGLADMYPWAALGAAAAAVAAAAALAAARRRR